MTVATAIVVPATLLEDDDLFGLRLRNDLGRNDNLARIGKLAAFTGEKNVTQRDLVASFTSQLFDRDLVSGGNSVLLAARAHNCEHGFAIRFSNLAAHQPIWHVSVEKPTKPTESTEGQNADTPRRQGPERKAQLVEQGSPVNEKNRRITGKSGATARLCYGKDMSRFSKVLVPTLTLGFLLTGCASGGPYPSLDRRAVERQYGSAQPVTPPISGPAQPSPETAPDAPLLKRLEGLRTRALAANREFESHEKAARRAVAAAAGAAVASEAWAVAHVELAQLDSARSNAMIALADLDSLLIAAAQEGAAGSGNLAAVTALRSEVTGWVSAQDTVLASLRGQLRS